MDKVEQIIGTLHIKLEQLVEENKTLKQRVSELIEESARYKSLSEERMKALADLEHRSEAVMTADQLVKHSGAEQAKGKIDELVREIDRCINLLSR